MYSHYKTLFCFIRVSGVTRVGVTRRQLMVSPNFFLEKLTTF